MGTAKLTLDEIEAIIDANKRANLDNMFEGLSSHDIGRRNGAIMFGKDDEAFPSQEEWSMWVD